MLTSGQSIVFEILVSWSTATWHFRITSTMWLASAFISYASYVSSDGPWRQMLHTRWFGPWSTPELNTITDSWLPVLSTCTRSYSPSSVPPSDLFCSFHIVHLFPELCEDSCTGSKCQIVSDSNCVPLNTDVCTDSLLPTCLISAWLPQSTLIWDQLWHSNGRCQFPRTNTKKLGPGRGGFYFASSAAWNAVPVHRRDPELSSNSFKTELKPHFLSLSSLPNWAFNLFVVRAIFYKLARASICIELNWIQAVCVNSSLLLNIYNAKHYCVNPDLKTTTSFDVYSNY